MRYNFQMKNKNANISNFFQAIAPLAKSEIELEDVLIISFLENAWKKQGAVQVNDVIHGITNLSPSTIHRRLRKMKLIRHYNTELTKRITVCVLLKKVINMSKH